MWSAAFATGFLELNLIFKTCQNAPFWAHLWDMINLELRRNKLLFGSKLDSSIFDMATITPHIIGSTAGRVWLYAVVMLLFYACKFHEVHLQSQWYFPK